MSNCNCRLLLCSPPIPSYGPSEQARTSNLNGGLWCGWMVPVVIVCIRAYHHQNPTTTTTFHESWRLWKVCASCNFKHFFSMLISLVKNPEFCLKPKPIIFSSSFFFSSPLHSTPQYSQTLPDKDDGWGRILAPAKPSSFLGAERYWVGGGEVEGSVLGRESRSQGRRRGGVLGCALCCP